MKYLLDKQTILICTGITEYKKYDTLQIMNEIVRGRQIFISFYTILDFLDENNCNIDKILDFIFSKNITVLPLLNESNFNFEIINKCIRNLGYTFKNTPFKFCKNAELFTINDSCLLEKISYNNKNENLNNDFTKNIESIKKLKIESEQIISKNLDISDKKYDLQKNELILLSYLPDFYIFTFNKQLLEIQRKSSEQAYHELDSFIKRHP